MNTVIVPRLAAGPGVTMLFLVLAALLLYGVSAAGLLRLWTSSETVTYGHGLLLLAVAVYIAFRRWRQLRPGIDFQASLPGFAFLLGISLAWLVATLASVQVVQQVLLVTVPAAIAWTVFGYRAARMLVLPTLLVLCAVPVWEILNQGQLQTLNALLAGKLVAFSGVSVFREGVTLTVPAGSFMVAENCSGMRQLMAAIPIGMLYAAMNGFGPLLSVAYVGAAAVVAVLVNVVRIYIIVMAGQATDMQHYFVTTDHVTLGWVLFGFGMFLFIFASARLPALRKAAGRAARAESAVPAPRPRRMLAMGLAIVGLGAGPALAAWYAGGPDDFSGGPLEFPSRIGTWETTAPADDYHPRVSGADRAFEAVYRHDGGGTVSLHVYFFHRQSQGREAVSSDNRVYDGALWRKTGLAAWREIDGRAKAISVQELIGPGGTGKLTWCWYELASWSTADPNLAKLYGVLAQLRGRPDAAMIVLAADAGMNDGAAEAAMTDFLHELRPYLRRVLTQAAVPASSLIPAQAGVR